MANKEQSKKIGKIYYWKRSDGKYAMNMVHTDRYSSMDCADTERDVKEIASKLGYVAIKD